MKKYIITGILALGLAGSAQAKPRHWYKDGKFWTGVAVIGASVALDAQSTCRAFARGAVEQTLATRGNTSCGTTAGVSVAAFGFYTGAHYLMWRYVAKPEGKQDTLGKLAYVTIPAIAVGVHISAAVHNYGIN